MPRDIGEWLEELGLSKYAALFAENEIDLELLPDLTEEDLKGLGIPLGPRKKLLKSISAFSGNPAAAGRFAEATPPPRAHAAAERRQLSIMFCDLVDSTALSMRFDPEDLREIMRAYQRACAAAIAQYGGFVAKYLGDGILAYFGYPQAHENDAERAARAGLSIVEAVAALRMPQMSMRDVELAVRIGIDTGLVVVGEIVGEGAAEEANVVGETPNVAARLQAVAQPAQVVVGPLTHELIVDKFACEDLGAHRLKGIAAPMHAWRVLGERDVESEADEERPSRGLPLVGRQEELGLLVRSWNASRRGHGQVVLLQGEGGIGKSRLVDRLRAEVLDESCACITARCSPYHSNSTLFPIIEHLKRVAGWRAGDSLDEKLGKLEAALEGQTLPPDRAVPLFAELLSLPLPPGRYVPLKMTAEEQREQTLDALASWLLEEAERRPVLCVWEDVHWADATTLELLRVYIEQSPTVSMMNVLTYRPEFVPPWTMRSHVTPITLNRLDRAEIEALVAGETGGKALPVEVVEYIAGKADGVPLYAEELTRAILEADFLREEDERYVATRPLADVTIPATLQDSLMARLDRLPTIREVAQLGAILGREFAYEMLKAIASLEEADLQKGLDQLVDAELLYQRGRRPRAKYIFKHALVQDAAYQSLLKRTRQYYHRQVAELLERRYSEVVESQPELLAHHYAQAGDHEKAIGYLTHFAAKAAGMYAHNEVVVAIEQARAHAEHLEAEQRDRHVLALVVRESESLHFLGRRQAILDLLLRYKDRLDGLQESSLGEYYFWLGFAHAWLGHREAGLECLERSLQAATRTHDTAVMGRVHRALATEFVYSGRRLDEAVAHARRAVSLLEATNDRLWLSQALFTLSYCCFFAGAFDAALEAAARLHAFGDSAGIRRAQANAAMLTGLVRAALGDVGEAVEACERARELSPDEFETAFVLAALGRACWEAGDAPRAVAILERAVELADEVRSLQFRAWFRTMLGEAYLSVRELEKAHAVATEALRASMSAGFLLGIGLSRQVLGRIALARGALADAHRDLDAALSALASIGARFELARVHVELAAAAQSETNGGAVARHLDAARSLFTALELGREVARVEHLQERLRSVESPGAAKPG